MGNHCGGHVAGTKFHVEKETASRLVKLPFRKTPFRKWSQIRVAKASQNEKVRKNIETMPHSKVLIKIFVKNLKKYFIPLCSVSYLFTA